MTRDDLAERFTVAIGRPDGVAPYGLERWLGEQFDVRVLSTVQDLASGAAAIEAGVVIIEAPRDGSDAIEAVRRLKSVDPRRPVVIVAPDLADDVVLDVLRLDVEGLVIAPGSPEVIADCVRQVRGGRLCLDPHIIRRAARTLLRRTASLQKLDAVLTAREIEIARLVGLGLTNKEIAARLFIAEGTIKVHLHKTFEKLQVRSRKELASYMQQRGLA